MLQPFILAWCLAYFLGSLPFAYLVTHQLRRVDIRTLGDGNPGGKNVFHQVHPAAGIAVALLDVGKGSAAIFLAQWLGLTDGALLAVGVAAIAGHNWSMFLHWRGGQGMATTVGVFLALLPLQTIVTVCIIALLLALLRNWDAACGIGFAALPIIEWWTRQTSTVILYSIALLLLIGLRKWMQRHPAFLGSFLMRRRGSH